MEISQIETLQPEQIKVQVKEILGEESYGKVASPSINWGTDEKEMAQYFDSVMDPIDAKMRSIYEESALPAIEKKLDEVRAKDKGQDELIEDKIGAFKRCLEEYTHSRIGITGGMLGNAINDRMNGNEDRAVLNERAFLYWYTEVGPHELRDVNGILQAVRSKAELEVAPPPLWDSSTNYGQYTPPESKSHYVKALKVLDLFPKS